MRRVWDVPTRIFHWVLVALFGGAWWSEKFDHMDWHTRAGLALCWLILFRLVWGFVGGSTARFSQFVKRPQAVWGYLRGRRISGELGHNPIGGWSVIALLATLGVQVATGLFAVDVDGINSGPLSNLVSFDVGRRAADLHTLAFNTLLVLVALHIVAILFYLTIKRNNLIRPMITGSAARTDDGGTELISAPIWRLILTLAGTGLFTYGIANGLHF